MAAAGGMSSVAGLSLVQHQDAGPCNPAREQQEYEAPSKHTRVACLDILRGFTIALMIFVDELGGPYPTINHSPWNNVTLADYVMPWFLFMVGTSISLSLRKYKQGYYHVRWGMRVVTKRTLKLFFLGVALQGGGWFGDYSYGYNWYTLRWCGILQRIAFAYFIAATVELWVSEHSVAYHWNGYPHTRIWRQHIMKWLVVSFFVVIYLIITFCVHVPDWESWYGYPGGLLNKTFTVHCDIHGLDTIKSPECSVASLVDRAFFGQHRLGAWMSTRLPECSSCSPGGPSKYNSDCHHWAPGTKFSDGTTSFEWCLAHMYDPEGLLATLPTVMSVWIGTHFGRLFLEPDMLQFGLFGPSAFFHWLFLGSFFTGIGLAVEAAGIPMNKQLWSLSYMFFMAGTCGIALAITWLLVDSATGQNIQDDRGLWCCIHSRFWRSFTGFWRKVFSPFEMMGMNAILVFSLHGTAEALLNILYVSPPWHPVEPNKANLQHWVTDVALAAGIQDDRVRQLIYVILKLICYFVGTWICYRRGYFWKL